MANTIMYTDREESERYFLYFLKKLPENVHIYRYTEVTD
jgi:hypothetical protein